MHKKICSISFMTSLSLLSYSQVDSSDLSFSTTNYIPGTLEDSISYGGSGFEIPVLEFAIDDLENFGRVWVEVICPDERAGETVFFYDAFTYSELTGAGYVEENLVNLPLPISGATDNCRVVIRIEDLVGHEKVSIAKHFEQ